MNDAVDTTARGEVPVRCSDTALDVAFDAVLDGAVELLAERTGQPRRVLRDLHERRAYELLAADAEHAGRITVTARTLANLLAPASVPHQPVTPAEHYSAAERRRQALAAGRPTGWLDPATFRRCLEVARAALDRDDDPEAG